jgi:hypothetical protein
MIEYWLLSTGSVIRTERTGAGFHNIDTGRLYSKHEFLQMIQGAQGHPITKEAYDRVIDGDRSFTFLD